VLVVLLLLLSPDPRAGSPARYKECTTGQLFPAWNPSCARPESVFRCQFFLLLEHTVLRAKSGLSFLVFWIRVPCACFSSLLVFSV
jgi:hypothetical protein